MRLIEIDTVFRISYMRVPTEWVALYPLLPSHMTVDRNDDGAIPPIIEAIVKAIVGKVGDLAKAGKDLIKGLWQGMSDAKDWIMDKIRDFMDDITDGIKDFFGIRSPSTLYAEIGRNLGLGIGVGFEGAMREVSRDMRFMGAIPAAPAALAAR